LVVRALLYISAEIGDCGPGGSPWSAKILKGVKKIITRFSYIVWPGKDEKESTDVAVKSYP